MDDVKPPTVVDLTWNGKLAFTARDGAHEWVLDGRSETGPSPVVALASALAGAWPSTSCTSWPGAGSACDRSAPG